jgi:hypothetical protein
MQVESTRLKLATYRGGIALVGPALLDATHYFGIVDLPGHPLHITLLTSSEYKSIGKSKPEFELDTRLPGVPLHRIYIVGVIRRKNVTFLVVLWNHADVWRKSLGLQKKEYHLTLSNEDDHDHINGKGISALLVSADDRDGIVENVIGLGEDAMDNVVVGCWGDLSLVSRQFHSRLWYPCHTDRLISVPIRIATRTISSFRPLLPQLLQGLPATRRSLPRSQSPDVSIGPCGRAQSGADLDYQHQNLQIEIERPDLLGSSGHCGGTREHPPRPSAAVAASVPGRSRTSRLVADPHGFTGPGFLPRFNFTGAPTVLLLDLP